MKLNHTLTFIFLLLVTAVSAQHSALDKNTKVPDHPRLLLLNGQEKEISANLKSDNIWKSLHQTIIAECESILKEPPVKHIKIGRRLLDKSRTCLLRVFYLSYAYRLTNEKKYLKRAEEEMLAAAAFSDWNPSHFLDVGEMTMALAIGYDWLYKDLQPGSKVLIKNAILKKGIEASLDSNQNGWLKSTNNWNQVCNAGIAYGALATYEDHPELSAKIINRAVKTITLPMKHYAPNGGYPEGYIYWEYGTSFNVMFISALQTAFGTDFGLSAQPGFLQTATFLENLTGTSGLPFNYADSRDIPQFNPAVFWFADRTKNASLLWVEKKSILGQDSLINRLLPAALIWGKNLKINNVPTPENNVWIGKGANPVALLRTSWTNPQAIFVGFKGGSPSASHGHMDVGSFVMDADGLRWGMDLGMQEYETLESKGIGLWNMKQNSQRWQVFRYNNLAHNTLAINNQLQLVDGVAAIDSYSSKMSFLNAVSDLTSVYDTHVSSLVRGLAIVDQNYVVVKDEVKTKSEAVTIRWSMVTPANVKIINDSTAELSQKGKKLYLKTQLPFAGRLTTWSTTPTTNYDALNPGTVIVGFEIKLPPNTENALTVFLVPQRNDNKINKAVPALAKWNKE